MTAFKLIVGLGNPGSKYEETRHNAGFFLLDEIARAYGANFSAEKKFHGEVARSTIATADVRLLKPATFMNLSGESVKAVAGFYRIEPEQILVAHDELDLDPGTVRLKKGGGHGGHNGLRDIISHLGKEFWRVRLGIGHPGSAGQVASFVLKRAPKSEAELLVRAIDEVMSEITSIVTGDTGKAMQSLHRKPEKSKSETDTAGTGSGVDRQAGSS
ncbi:aminoacyl-tRNA hydrolase [Chromatiales bacterium (ex Bugula neritina AB1)]|nr:aminoacyl-tRNA hydrolase [Chromatiales bacterium (ex Bugula neritina AB1)]